MLRNLYLQQINQGFNLHPVVVMLGPRQCGKTTLARQFLAEKIAEGRETHYFDLEDPTDFTLFTNPKSILEPLHGLIIIDEVQHIADLFKLIRVLVDQNNNKRQFLILGSASYELSRQTSETLAGRVHFLEINPFRYMEVKDLRNLWLRGGYPRSFLANNYSDSCEWREQYIRTFLERDIPLLGIAIDFHQMRRFWMMLTHYHGQIVNMSDLSRSLNITQPTVKRYLDLLEFTFMIRQLSPWHENLSKRQVKANKIYFRDPGIFHSLLEINAENAILKHPKLGASWEGFALEEIIRYHQARNSTAFFWGTHSGAEIDLLIKQNGQTLGFEFKFQDAPIVTKSMRVALADLKLDQLTIIYPGNRNLKLEDRIDLVGLELYLLEC